jgi:hypothetical protein
MIFTGKAFWLDYAASAIDIVIRSAQWIITKKWDV